MADTADDPLEILRSMARTPEDRIRVEADAKCAELVAGLRAMVNGHEDRAALAAALARAAETFREESLAEYWEASGYLMAYPTTMFDRLSRLTGLSVQTLRPKWGRAFAAAVDAGRVHPKESRSW